MLKLLKVMQRKKVGLGRIIGVEDMEQAVPTRANSYKSFCVAFASLQTGHNSQPKLQASASSGFSASCVRKSSSNCIHSLPFTADSKVLLGRKS